jgi:hypothetical protein
MTNAPITRTVCQLTGHRSYDAANPDGPSAFFRALAALPDGALPTEPAQPTDVAELVAANAWLRSSLAEITQQRDDARAELDNMMGARKDLGRLVAELTSSEAMWHADRDEQRERGDEWRDKAEGYLATIDCLEAEIAELKREKSWNLDGYLGGA